MLYNFTNNSLNSVSYKISLMNLSVTKEQKCVPTTALKFHKLGEKRCLTRILRNSPKNSSGAFGALCINDFFSFFIFKPQLQKKQKFWWKAWKCVAFALRGWFLPNQLFSSITKTLKLWPFCWTQTELPSRLSKLHFNNGLVLWRSQYAYEIELVLEYRLYLSGFITQALIASLLKVPKRWAY